MHDAQISVQDFISNVRRENGRRSSARRCLILFLRAVRSVRTFHAASLQGLHLVLVQQSDADAVGVDRKIQSTAACQHDGFSQSDRQIFSEARPQVAVVGDREDRSAYRLDDESVTLAYFAKTGQRFR